jgi:hypothetical protein
LTQLYKLIAEWLCANIRYGHGTFAIAIYLLRRYKKLGKSASLALGFKKILYAENEDDLHDLFDALITSDMASEYPNFNKYVTDGFEDCEAWAVCYRIQLPRRGSNTNI